MCPTKTMFQEASNFLDFVEELYAQDTAGVSLIEFNAKEMLMHQGAAAQHVFVLKSGLCKIGLEEENGKEYILAFLSTGEILGELELIRDAPRLCSVQSLNKVEAYKLTKACFLNLLNTDLKLNSLIINAYADRITNTSKKASFQKLYTTENGLQRILKLQETENIEISKADLSAYLGISARRLNRLLKQRGDS